MKNGINWWHWILKIISLTLGYDHLVIAPNWVFFFDLKYIHNKLMGSILILDRQTEYHIVGGNSATQATIKYESILLYRSPRIM